MPIIAESFRNSIAKIAANIPGADGRDAILAYLALQHTEAGELDTAVELVDQIEDTYQRDVAFSQVAVKCVATGQADRSESLLDYVGDEAAQALATEQLAVAYAAAGEIDRAVDVAHRLPDGVPALAGVALECVHAGRKDEAIGLLESIDYPDLRVPVLSDLASWLVENHAETKTEALEFLAEAAKAAEEIETSSPRIDAQRLIITLYQKCGDEEAALEILGHALDQSQEGATEDEADYARAQVAAAYAELRHFEDAERVLEEIDNPHMFADATAAVAVEYKAAGNQAKALELLAEALELAKEEEIYGYQTFKKREEVFDKLAQSYEELGNYETSLEIVTLMNDSTSRDNTLSSMARKAAASGNSGRALQVLEKIEDEFLKTACESKLVGDFRASDQPEMAERVLAQALTHATALAGPTQRAMMLADIAPWFVTEQPAKAHEILFDALQAAAEIQQLELQASALINVASGYAGLKLDPREAEEELLEGITSRLE